MTAQIVASGGRAVLGVGNKSLMCFATLLRAGDQSCRRGESWQSVVHLTSRWLPQVPAHPMPAQPPRAHPYPFGRASSIPRPHPPRQARTCAFACRALPLPTVCAHCPLPSPHLWQDMVRQARSLTPSSRRLSTSTLYAAHARAL